MICKNCGMQNNEGSKFCIGCGSPIQEEIINEPVIPNQSIDNLNVYEPINNSVEMNNPVVHETMNNQIVNHPVDNFANINNQNANQPQMATKPVSVQNKETKVNKKLLFIIGGSVLGVAIITILLILLLGGNKDSKNIVSLFDLDQPIPVYKDGGYVYIDTKGKMQKNIKYNLASDFSGDFAYVELEDGTSALIDKNQNIKVSATGYYAIEYIEEIDSWLIDGVLYDSKLNVKSDKNLELKKEENGYFTYNNKDYTEYGVINGSGKVVYKSKTLIHSLDICEHTGDLDHGIIVLEDGTNYKEYLVSLDDGTVIYENKYKDPTDAYSNSLNESYNGIFYVNDENYDRAETIYVKDKKVVYSIKGDIYDLELYGKDYLEIDYGYYYEDLGKDQRYYYYDLKNEKLLKEEPKIEEEKETEEKVNIKERQIVSCDNGYGLIDDKKVIIPCMYDEIDYLPSNVHEYMKQKESKDLMYVEDNDKTFIYDANKREEYLTFESSDNYKIIDSSNSLFIVQEHYIEDPDSWGDKLNKIIIYNLMTKQKIEFDSKSDIELKLNYFKEKKNGKTMYYNMDFEKIYTES